MTAGDEASLPGVKVAVYPKHQVQVRWCVVDYEPRLVAVDAATALGVNGAWTTKSENLINVHLGNETVSTFNLAGLREFVAGLAQSPERDRFLTWAEVTFGPKKKREPKGPDASRWGWQPLRTWVKKAGLSGREFVERANALDLPGTDTFTTGNYAAWSYGGCLPQESLVRRAEALLSMDRTELFTTEVLENLPHRGRGKRHPKREVADVAKDVPAEPQGH